MQHANSVPSEGVAGYFAGFVFDSLSVAALRRKLLVYQRAYSEVEANAFSLNHWSRSDCR